MVQFCIEIINDCEKKVIFTIPLPGRNPAFMSIAITKYEMEHRGVVIVDSGKFLKLWRSNPNSDQQSLANGSPDAWRKDSKYKEADMGFSVGRTNPIPLATIFYSPTPSYVAIADGTTRTIWLLAHNCLAFPIKCDLSDGPELFLLAAVEETLFYTIGEDGLIKASLS